MGSPRCSGRMPTATSRARVGRERGGESRWRRHGQPLVADHALERIAVAFDPALEEVHRGRADEGRDEEVVGLVVELLRRALLLEQAVAHDRDPRAHRHRLDLVVGDVHRRHAELALKAGDLGAHLGAQLRVEVRERLVHQEHLRARGRSRAPSPPAGAARPRARAAFVRACRRGRAASRSAPRAPGSPLSGAAGAQREGQVVEHGHVRVERVVLEDHRDVALLGVERVDDPVADPDLALGDLLEAGGHPQCRRLAAPGGADEHHQLAVGDLEVELGRRPAFRPGRPCRRR